MLPGTDPEELLGEFRDALAGLDVELELAEAPLGGTRSPLDTPLRDALAEWVDALEPGALMVPEISTGFTDSHYLREAFGTVAYGFFPLRYTAPELLDTIHAPDERIDVRDLELAVRAFVHCIDRIGSVTHDRRNPPRARDAKLRLGGIALRNGLALFGPTSWAAAVRTADGGIHVASGRRPRSQSRRPRAARARRRPHVRDVRRAAADPPPPARGPALVRARQRRRLGDHVHARSPPSHAAAAASAVSSRSTVIGIVPSLVTLRNRDLVRYHGAEHKTVAGYEQGVEAATTAKEHERCGSHLVAPLLLGTAGAAALTARTPAQVAPARRARSARWRLDRHRVRAVRLARAAPRTRSAHGRWRGPGFALQRALATAEPGDAELEVADRALEALLAAEAAGAAA